MHPLRRARRAATMTQGELAALSGIHEQTVRSIEVGRVVHPHPKTLRLLASALHCQPVDIMGPEPEGVTTS